MCLYIYIKAKGNSNRPRSATNQISSIIKHPSCLSFLLANVSMWCLWLLCFRVSFCAFCNSFVRSAAWACCRCNLQLQQNTSMKSNAMLPTYIRCKCFIWRKAREIYHKLIQPEAFMIVTTAVERNTAKLGPLGMQSCQHWWCSGRSCGLCRSVLDYLERHFSVTLP